MPKGIYLRTPEYLALLSERMSRRHRDGTTTGPTAHLHTPEMRARAQAANRIARPPKKYARIGGKSNSQLVHRMRAEKALGKPLPFGAVVHHADGSKNAYAPLVICQDNPYHTSLHRRMRVQKAGGDPWLDKICAKCKQIKPKTEFWKDRTSPEGLATKCSVCCYSDNKARRSRKRLERIIA